MTPHPEKRQEEKRWHIDALYLDTYSQPEPEEGTIEVVPAQRLAEVEMVATIRTAKGNEAERKRVEAAEQRVAELEKALGEAIDMVIDWGAYASEYFQEKWDLQGDIAKLRAVIQKAREEPVSTPMGGRYTEGRDKTGVRCEGCGCEQRVRDEGWETRDMLDWCPRCFVPGGSPEGEK